MMQSTLGQLALRTNSGGLMVEMGYEQMPIGKQFC